ncbi:hypothetical protein ACMD2_19654 [Ananas comosus]|uniref:Uncharacterized protein n=1 Tax=Ananas comosus TaxID=4615 RepID=A0A199V995_ANACO|nr:hypothetical protein ACMD2_19654 [Ananas comosus]
MVETSWQTTAAKASALILDSSCSALQQPNVGQLSGDYNTIFNMVETHDPYLEWHECNHAVQF